jgi:hypothetical protein
MPQTTKVVTGKVRFSYAHVFEPHSVEEGGVKKYSVSLLIPKSDTATVTKIKAAIELAIVEGTAKHFAGKRPANLKTPLRDGDVATDALIERANATGRALFTRTVLDGRSALRFSIGGRTTDERHVREGWELLRSLA